MKPPAFILFIPFIFFSCTTQSQKTKPKTTTNQKAIVVNKQFDTAFKTIHVLVALCDNKYQGIVPVPVKIGNGQDVNNNLYWGCGFGVRSYFKKSKQWKLVRQYAVNDTILERLVFKNTGSNYYLVADAYNGKFIKECTVEFFRSCAGITKDTLQGNNKTIGVNGNAALVAYIGHDGLMDFLLREKYDNADGITRDAIMLACISKKYFAHHLLQTKANPVLWSTGLMSPEVYTLHDALEMYINKKPLAIKAAAAKAYSKYQQCSIKAASGLLVSGW